MKVAILGTVPVSRAIAPYDDPEWKIWVCSAGNRGACPRIDVWFEIHALVDLEGAENAGWVPDYFAWLRSQPFEVWMQEPNVHVPQARIFPRKALVAEFGRLPFSSSIAWMIAFAIFHHATEIAIYGVDMAAPEEWYTNQKFGLLRMLEIAHQRGIKVKVPLESCLGAMPPLYGYAEASRKGRRLLVKELEIQKAISDLDATIDRLVAERHMFRGALDQVKYYRRTFVDGEDDAEIDVVNEDVAPPGAVLVHHAVNGHADANGFDRTASIETVDTVKTAGGLLVPTGPIDDHSLIG